MRPDQLAKPGVLTQPVYEPGRPIADVAREHGLDPDAVIKLASNENPLGPSPLALAAAHRALDDAHLYPDGAAIALRAKIAANLGLDPAQIFPGNGSNEDMQLLAEAFISPGDEVVAGRHAFIVFKYVTLFNGGVPVEVDMPCYTHDLAAMRRAVTPRTKIVYLPTPNNPTGTANRAAEVAAFARDLPPHVILCVDEAYVEFLEPGEAPDLRPLIAEGRNIFCCRTFSKIYGLAGLRVGYGYGPKPLIDLLHRVRQPFNVNAVAQAAAVAAMDDREHVERTREINAAGLRQVAAGLKKLGLEATPSVANFIMFRVAKAREVFLGLQAHGVIVRPLAPYDLPEHLRVTIGTAEQNTRFLDALARVVKTL
ncbi:MAG TPA: histidinol-phosphate transaminase [Opitutales bacterium]|nr:histidinol-phosphate transaminase [Opitutales bacterium]